MRPASPPTTELPELFHVGMMDASDKVMGGPSYEGEGLSVCSDPAAWATVAQLDAMPWWHLSNPDAVFVDRHGLSGNDWQHVLSWACAQGWVSRARLWEIRFFDEALDAEVAFCLVDAAEAHEQARARAGTLRRVRGLCATEVLARRTGVRPGEPGVEDLALACWVADMSTADGIWWDDPVDLARLSAPRGVVMPGALRRWHIEPAAPARRCAARPVGQHLLACRDVCPHCEEQV